MAESEATIDPRLLRLRVELYYCAQALKGEDATEFWKLMDEIQLIRRAFGNTR